MSSRSTSPTSASRRSDSMYWMTLLSTALLKRGSSLTQTTATVASRHTSCVSTSATATLKRLRTRRMTDLTTIRLSLSELLSGRCSSSRATPTCMAMLAPTPRLAEVERGHDLIEGRAHVLELVGGGRAREQVGGRAADHGNLEAACLVGGASGVVLGEGEDQLE